MRQTGMRVVTESGFRFTVSADSSFRMADCAAYQALSGKHLKEMDVGWWQDNRLFLLELKGDEVWQPGQRPSDQLVQNLAAKANDMLLLLSAAWLGTDIGQKVAQELPSEVSRGLTKLKLIFLLDTPAQSIPLLMNLKDKLNRVLSGRLHLFGLRHVTLVDFEGAKKMGLLVERTT